MSPFKKLFIIFLKKHRLQIYIPPLPTEEFRFQGLFNRLFYLRLGFYLNFKIREMIHRFVGSMIDQIWFSKFLLSSHHGWYIKAIGLVGLVWFVVFVLFVLFVVKFTWWLVMGSLFINWIQRVESVFGSWRSSEWCGLGLDSNLIKGCSPPWRVAPCWHSGDLLGTLDCTFGRPRRG